MVNDFHHSDPLPKVLEFPGRELMKRFGAAATGFPSNAVLDACVNLMVNALRQSHGKRTEVIARVDELHAHLMKNLLQFYDPVTNRRRSTVPFTQVLGAPLIDDKDGLR